MLAWLKADQCWIHRDSSASRVREVVGNKVKIEEVRVLGPQAAAIPDPAGGSVVDSEARTTLAALLVMLRSHGLITT
jgi:hypothetical protein